MAPPTGARLAALETSPRGRPPSAASSPARPVTKSGEAEAGGKGAESAAAAARGSGTSPRAGGGDSAGGAVVASGQNGPDAEAVAAASKARARASTLDLYFRKLMQRAAEVVAELCLRRLQLPGDTADQVRLFPAGRPRAFAGPDRSS